MTIASTNKADFLKEQIIEKIQNGEFPVGEKLPPVRSLVKKFGVSLVTVSKALSLLKENGIIKLEPKKLPVVLRKPARYRILIVDSGLGIKGDAFWREVFEALCDELRKYPEPISKVLALDC